MARVKCPLLSVEASGTVGGLEFKRSSYGNVVSRRSITPVIRSPRALAVRDNLHIAHVAWMTLSDTAKAAWHIGAPPNLTGRLSYISAHIQAKTLGILLPDNPTKPTAPVHLGPISVEYQPGPPRLLLFSYDATGDLDCPVSLWTNQTWSGRASPKRTAYRFQSWDYAGVGGLFFTNVTNGPRVNWQIRVHDKLNGICCATISGHIRI